MVAELALPPGTRKMLVQKLPRPRMVAVHTGRFRHRTRQVGLHTSGTDFIRTRETRNHLPRFFRVHVAAYVTGHREDFKMWPPPPSTFLTNDDVEIQRVDSYTRVSRGRIRKCHNMHVVIPGGANTIIA